MEYEKLGSLAQFINGFAFKPEDWSSKGKKIIRIQNLTDHNKNFNYTERLVPDKYIVNQGDVLVSWSATIDVFIWNYDEQALLNQHIFKVIFDDDIVFKNYFIFALKHTINELNKLAHGSTMRHIVKGEFENHKIPLPAYADQIRIANVLGKIEEIIQARKNAIYQLDELVKAFFSDMFGDPITGIKFKRLNFGEISKVRQGLQIPISKRKKYPGINLYPYITNQFLNGGKIAEFIENPKRSVICTKDDVLMTRTGNTGIVITNVEGVFHNNFFLIDYDRNILVKNYLVHFLKFDSIKQKILKLASTTTIPDLNHKDFYSVDIIIPPLDLQIKFASVAQKIETLKSEQEKQLLDLEKLYTSVSHAAFSGTLDLSRIPYDERLLPVVEPVNEPEVIDKKKEEPKELENKIPLQLNGLSGKRTKDVLPSTNEWSKLSFKKIAELINNHFQANYFNSEMLLRFLTEEAKLNVDYFSSKEQKLNQKLENANDFLIFLSDAVTDKNPYLKLEQVFYDAEKENIKDITFTTQDLETISKKTSQERSGIYFRIKNETTTR